VHQGPERPFLFFGSYNLWFTTYSISGARSRLPARSCGTARHRRAPPHQGPGGLFFSLQEKNSPPDSPRKESCSYALGPLFLLTRDPYSSDLFRGCSGRLRVPLAPLPLTGWGTSWPMDPPAGSVVRYWTPSESTTASRVRETIPILWILQFVVHYIFHIWCAGAPRARRTILFFRRKEWPLGLSKKRILFLCFRTPFFTDEKPQSSGAKQGMLKTTPCSSCAAAADMVKDLVGIA